MRTVAWIAAKLLHAIFERWTDSVFEAMGLCIDLIPGETHHLHQEYLQEPVSPHQLQRGQPSLLGQRNAFRIGAVDEAGIF